MRPGGERVIDGLKRALEIGGLSQAEMSRALGTSASRFSTYMTGKTVPSAALFVHAQQLGEAFAAARQRGWLTPLDAVRAIRDAIGEGDRAWALRLILECRDHGRAALAHPHHPDAVAAWAADPGSCGAEDFDALLAGLVGHEFGLTGRPVPGWAAATGREGPWLFASPFFNPTEVENATPPWLRDRGVLIAARDLVTV